MGHSAGATLTFGLSLDDIEEDKIEAISDVIGYSSKGIQIDYAGDFCRGGVEAYLVIEDLSINSSWAEKIDPTVMAIPTEKWRDQLKVFCDEHDLPWAEPTWLLLASFG